MLNKLRNNIGAVILIAILGLVLLGATYANVGPTTDFEGDVGVPAGSGYYIDDVLMAYSDVGAQQLDTALTNISALTYVSPSFIKLTADDTYEVRTLAETKEDLNLNYVENLKVKLDATEAPAAATDDITLGYVIGSRWFDVTNDKEYVCLDNTDGAAVWTETTGAGGGAGTFLELTDTPVAYDDGKYAKSTAAGIVFDTPAGSGDMSKSTYDIDEDNDIDVAAGGTEKSSWTQYCIPYLSGTTAFGEIPVGTAGQVLKVSAGATGYEFADETGGGASELSDLSDVNTSTPTDKFVLIADGTDFESRALVEADISDLGTYLTDITDESIFDLSDSGVDPNADKYPMWDDDPGIIVWGDAPSSYTNLTSFINQTAWRLFYSNTDGDVTEVALGTDGQVFTSAGVDVAPSFEDAGGAGEVNTASNIGTGAEVYSAKDGVDLEFRKIEAGSDKIDISWYTEGEYSLKESYTLDSAGYSNLYLNHDNMQTFTTTDSYNISKVSVRVKSKNGTPNTDITVEIKAVDGDHKPTGAALASGTIPKASISTTIAYYDCVFNSSYLLSAATEYAIVVSSDISGVNPYYQYKETTGTYSDGVGMSSANGGSDWTDYDNDFYFKNYTKVLAYKDQIEIDVVPAEIPLDTLGSPTDITTLDASTTAHGLLPKLPFSGDLLSTTTVSFAADADTTLYTVPTGKRCVLTHAIVVTAADAGATTTISIGANGAETDFIPANTLSNLDAQYDSVILQPIPNTTPLKIKSYAAATVIEAQVASQSGSADNTVYLFGITY